MKLETALGPRSKKEIARGKYDRWISNTKESKIYICVLFALARGKCPTCGVDMVLSFNEEVRRQDNSATLDHTIPIALVKEHHKYGLEIMCRKCNQEKGVRDKSFIDKYVPKLHKHD